MGFVTDSDESLVTSMALVSLHHCNCNIYIIGLSGGTTEEVGDTPSSPILLFPVCVPTSLFYMTS